MSKLSKKQLKEDINFLAEHFNYPGASARSIIMIAYGKESIENQTLPYDLLDLKRCEYICRALPAHRKTDITLESNERVGGDIFVIR